MTHLSSEQLAQLKSALLENLRDIPVTIETLEKQDPFKDPEYVSDNASIDTDVREQMEHETVEAEILALRKKLNATEEALRRMDAGTYGMDEHSNEPIPFERLQIMPEARHTIATEKRLVK